MHRTHSPALEERCAHGVHLDSLVCEAWHKQKTNSNLAAANDSTGQAKHLRTYLGGRLHSELAVAGADGVEGPDLGVARGVLLAVKVPEKALS